MRYLPLTPDDRRAMLAKIGVSDVDALFRDVPKSALTSLSTFDLPDTQGELEVERALSKLAAKNIAAGAAPFFASGAAKATAAPNKPMVPRPTTIMFRIFIETSRKIFALAVIGWRKMG